ALHRVTLAVAEIARHGTVLLRDLVELTAALLNQPIELLELDFPIAIQLAKLFDFALSVVRLALRAATRELLARAFDLDAHLAELADEIAARLLHLVQALLAARE